MIKPLKLSFKMIVHKDSKFFRRRSL